MHHGPAAPLEQDNASDAKASIGLRLFILYSIVYAGFIIINTADPATMGKPVLLGLNLAVVYGFGLIVLAVLMGLIYHVICVRVERRLNPTREEGES